MRKSILRLLHQVFEFSTWTELWRPRSWNFDWLASLWIATSAGFALRFCESAEADQFNVVAFLNCFFDSVDSTVQNCFSVSF